MNRTATPQRTCKSLKFHLITLVVVAVLPVLLYSASLLIYLSLEQSKAIERNLKSTTRALAIAVDLQINSLISSANMLAMVEEFDHTKFKSLHGRLKRYVSNEVGWHSLSVADVNGRQYFNTILPYEATLPDWRDQDFFQKALQTKKFAISNLRSGKVTGEKLISVAIPVQRDSKILYVLVANIKASYLSQVLKEQKLPSGWTATILDKTSTIIARSRKPKTFAGTPATPALSLYSKVSPEDVFRDTDKEGEKLFGAFSRAEMTGWAVALEMPAKILNVTNMNTFWMLLGGGSFLLSLGIVLAYAFSKRISDPILSLTNSAIAFGEGRPLAPIESSVEEVFEAIQALNQAAAEKDANEETIRNLYEKAQNAVALRDTFLSVASHELKTPLTTLKLQFQILEKSFQKNEMVSADSLAKPIERVLNQVTRLSVLVDDLLDVSRITGNKIELRPEKVFITHLLQEIAGNFEKEAETKGTFITVEGEESIEGYWDKGRLDQVFTNLISNALKYGAGKPVEITIIRKDDLAVVSVKDSGPGISPEDQEKIFEQFERGKGVESISGLGLGLWIVKRILEQMKSNITLTSSSENGTCFTVELPIHENKL